LVAAAGGSLVQGQPELHSEFKASWTGQHVLIFPLALLQIGPLQCGLR
jgi:hypothetical protein